MSGQNRRRLLLLLLSCLMATACTDQSDESRKAVAGPRIAVGAEDKGSDQEGSKTRDALEVKDGAGSARSAPAGAAKDGGAGQEDKGIITVRTTERTKGSDEEIPVRYTDDLSLLSGMGPADISYAYRAGCVYYRQYHKDSYEEGALWAAYRPTAGTEKEIVCIDAEGEKTVLFKDKGYGSIYLAGERFFMTEMVSREEDGISYDISVIYSVDMQGQDRMEHGAGTIAAFDMDRNVLILKLHADEGWEETYAALDAMDGRMTPLVFKDCASMFLWAYADGWCYFDAHDRETEDRVCRVAAVSITGEQKEIVALAQEDRAQKSSLVECICQMEVDGDRLYIVFGGYAGSGNFYQGGRIITIKLDGSDYRALEAYNDAFHVCHDGGRTLVYLPHSYQTEEDVDHSTTVWDMEAGTLSPSQFPYQFIYQQQDWPMLPFQEHAVSRPLCMRTDEGTDVYALPGESGMILPVAMDIDEKIIPYDGEGTDLINYEHLYHADGYLYFEVVYNIYDEDLSIGWRDGYRRAQTDVYRLKLDGDKAELLYSY